jgi:hypothetical protein
MAAGGDAGLFRLAEAPSEAVEVMETLGVARKEASNWLRSDRSRTGYKGACLNHGRYEATCTTSPCGINHLGSFDRP